MGVEAPSEVRVIAAEEVEKHATPEKAIAAVEKRVKALAQYQKLVAALVRLALADIVYDLRHEANVRSKRRNGAYGQAAKVKVGDSPAVLNVADSLYRMRIAGTLLGLLTRDELEWAAEVERAQSNGHLVNARLCEKLAPLVPSGKTVRQAVSEEKLRKLLAAAEKEIKGE